MHRLSPALLSAFCVLPLFAIAQTVSQPSLPTSDPQAISLAQKAVAALEAGATISDVTLNANVTWISGSDNETGTGTFQAKGFSESRIYLNLSGGSRTDVRNISGGFPAGAWKKNGANAIAYAQHNCWADASWFFPALSSLVQVTNSNFFFAYVGQEQHAGVSVQHIRVSQFIALFPSPVSTTDFYLDVNSYLPLAVAVSLHPDNDMNTNIPSEIRFANYQAVNGIQVPFHFQQLVDGTVNLDVIVTNAAFNTGLQDSQFTLQ